MSQWTKQFKVGGAVVAAAFFSIFVSFAAAEDNASGSANVLKVSGKVDVRKGAGPWAEVKPADVLSEGDEILVGPNAVCDLGLGENNEKIVKLDADTRVTLESLKEPYLLNLQSGRTFALVTGLKDEKTFSVRTPTAIASARGTAWVQESMPGNRDRLVVHASKVYLQAYGKSVVIKPNQVADITTDAILTKAASDEDRLQWGSFLSEVKDHLDDIRTPALYVADLRDGKSKKVTVLPKGKVEGQLLKRDKEYSKADKFCLPPESKVVFQDDLGTQVVAEGPGVGNFEALTESGALKRAYVTAVVAVEEGAVVVDDGKTQSLIKGGEKNTQSSEEGADNKNKAPNIVVQDACNYKIFAAVDITNLYIQGVEPLREEVEARTSADEPAGGPDRNDDGAGDDLGGKDGSGDDLPGDSSDSIPPPDE